MTTCHHHDALAMETSRLTLRYYREDDLPQVRAFRSDPDAVRFMDDLPETPAQTREWLAGAIHHNRLRPRSAYNLAIALAGYDRVIGWIGFGDSERHPGTGNYGVGFMLGSAYWNNGYASEALAAVSEYIFDSLHGQFISAWCDAGNPASARVMTNAGYTFTRQFEDTAPNNGQPRRCLEFSRHTSPGWR